MSGKIESFEQLEAYQMACALDLAVFAATKFWPKEEMYSLTDQSRVGRLLGAMMKSGDWS